MSRHLTDRHAADLRAAIATVSADPARSIRRGECWHAVGRLLGISGACAQRRAVLLGIPGPEPRPRGTQPCVRCGEPRPEANGYDSDGAGCCARCQTRLYARRRK